MKELNFALYSIKKNFKSSAELRTSFLMNIIGMFINNFAFILLWVFFVKSVGVIGGWTAYEIIGLQGFSSLAFGMVFSVGAGFKQLPVYTASGAFDRFMLSPKNLLLRIATSTLGASAVGDIIFGIVCCVIYAFLIQASIVQILLMLLLMFISTLVLFSAVIIIYSMSFFFTDASSITYGFFQLFFAPSLFHGGAFQGALRFIFVFIIPSLLIGAYPVEIVKNISLDKLLLVVILTIFWFTFSIKFFNFSVKKYESSNFMTFGN